MNFAQVLTNGIVLGAILALMAVGLTLIFGILRVINFTHGVLYMLGAYATFILAQWDVPYLLAVPIAAVAVGLIGIVFELGILSRFRGSLVEGAVVTLALAVIVQNVVVLIAPAAPKGIFSPFEGSVSFAGVTLSVHRVFVFVTSLLIVIALTLLVNRSRFGQSIRALQQDAYAARLQGIEQRIVAPGVFGLGAALAGLSGALIAPIQQIQPGIGDQTLLSSFVVVVVGGLGSVSGTFAAAILIGVVQSVVTSYWSAPAAVAVGFAMAITVLVVRPNGIFGHA